MTTLEKLKNLVDLLEGLEVSYVGQHNVLISLFRDSKMKTRGESTKEFQFLKNQILVLHTLYYLHIYLRESWLKETCYPGDAEKWDLSNPSIGQCAVTALVVQKYLGGEIVYTKTSNIHHFWNNLPNGRVVDFTREQFGPDIEIGTGSIRTRESILEGDGAVATETPTRYMLLLARIENRFRETREAARQGHQCGNCGGCSGH